MHRTRTTLATLLLLTPTASALDLEAPSNKLREVSSYLDKACTVVQTVGGYADGAQSAGQVISTIEGLLGSNTGIGGAFAVCCSVRISNSSSKVPKPPGNTTSALARMAKCILRIAM